LISGLAGKGMAREVDGKRLKKIKNPAEPLSFIENSFYLVSIRTVHLLMIKPILVILFLP